MEPDLSPTFLCLSKWIFTTSALVPHRNHQFLKNNFIHNLDSGWDRRRWINLQSIPQHRGLLAAITSCQHHPSNSASGWCFPLRIVCEMGEAKPSQHAGFVEICVAECKPEFMARSSQLYYFMVSS